MLEPVKVKGNTQLNALIAHTDKAIEEVVKKKATNHKKIRIVMKSLAERIEAMEGKLKSSSDISVLTEKFNGQYIVNDSSLLNSVLSEKYRAYNGKVVLSEFGPVIVFDVVVSSQGYPESKLLKISLCFSDHTSNSMRAPGVLDALESALRTRRARAKSLFDLVDNTTVIL